MTSSDSAFGDRQEPRHVADGIPKKQTRVNDHCRLKNGSNSSVSDCGTQRSRFTSGTTGGEVQRLQNVREFIERLCQCYFQHRLLTERIGPQSERKNRAIGSCSVSPTYCRWTSRASRKRGFVMFLVVLFPVFMGAVAAEGLGGISNGGREESAFPVSQVERVVTLSPCRAVVAERVINLEPLQRTDGLPR